MYKTSGFFMSDRNYMQTALDLAAKGTGYVSPNPLVGAVVVKDGKIVGKGFHEKFGGPHAEVNALNEAGSHAKGADLYCTLEPCSHFGKTPPCTEKITKSGIKRVVIAMGDPNPLVNGNGIKMLKDKGIVVKSGVLEKKTMKLNRAFIKYISTGIPYVTLKMAQTINGKINAGHGLRTPITGKESQKYVHKLRSVNDAVLIGKNTAVIDDPLLTPRAVNGRTPKRIIIDAVLETSLDSKIFHTLDKGEVYLAVSDNKNSKRKELLDRGVKIIDVFQKTNGRIDLLELLQELGKINIASVLVEGGAGIFTEMINKKLVDNIVVLIAPRFFGKGLNVIDDSFEFRELEMKNITRKNLGKDILIEGEPVYKSGQ